MRGDIRSALEGLNESKAERQDGEELEELWLNELIQRRKNEIKVEEEQAKEEEAGFKEEQKRPTQTKTNNIIK